MSDYITGDKPIVLSGKGLAWLKLHDVLKIGRTEGGRKAAQRLSKAVTELAGCLAESGHPWSKGMEA